MSLGLATFLLEADLMLSTLWTKPYYGISHLKQPNRKYQFTVHENPDGTAYGYMLDRKSGRAYTPTREIHAINVGLAKKELEAWAKVLTC
jgi:hypothetical protein